MSNSTASTTNEMWAENMIQLLRHSEYTGQLVFHVHKSLIRKLERRDFTTTEQLVEAIVDSERVGRG